MCDNLIAATVKKSPLPTNTSSEGPRSNAHISVSLVMADMSGTQSKLGKSNSKNLQVLPVTSSMSPFVGLLMNKPVLLLASSSAWGVNVSDQMKK